MKNADKNPRGFAFIEIEASIFGHILVDARIISFRVLSAEFFLHFKI